MDDLRFRAQQSSRNDASMASFASPPRNGPRLPQPSDPRSSLPRRFTTDSGRVPTLSNITTQQRGPEPQELSATTALHKVQLLEKMRLEYENLREKKRRFEAEMQKLDQQQRREEQELAAMQEDLGRIGAAAANMAPGHQSEPTTPPEYRETSSGFPSMFSRPNRYSTSSLTSPPGLLFNRPGRSGSQIASPQSGIMQSSQQHITFDDSLPSRSVPGSRRNSDEDDKEEAVRQDPTSHRSTNALNRYSMPVTRSKSGFYDFSSLDQTNTTRFLFGEDEDHSNGESKLYQANNTKSSLDENFPTLTRREGQPHMLSASSAALDLALAQLSNTDTAPANDWSGSGHHRGQPSMSGMTSAQRNSATLATSGAANSSEASTLRHSFDMKYYTDNTSDVSASIMSSPTNHILATPPKLQSSYSANDVSTIKTTPGSVVSNTNNHAQQYLHNHNASLGRIPAGAIPNRHSRELSSGDMSNVAREFASISSALHANAVPFGSTPGNFSQAPSSISTGTLAAAAAAASAGTVAALPPSTTGSQYIGYYGGPNYPGPASGVAAASGPTPYGPNSLQALSQTMQAMSLNGGPMYQAQGFNGYPSMYGMQGGPAQIRDSQARVIQSRRQLDNEAMNRYNNTPLEAVGGTIYELCKDQHGCRYLQKQLENRNPEQVHMIWLETNQHVVELMTDPFGNYLCQKLLEYCNDDERTVLIQNAAQDMVRIALNQHGTRALQKMIEFISTETQVQIIIEALRHCVVDLIKDLNGNHVIQKCLNKLTPANAQFIFDAVGGACVEVGTHRHGCCVLQRCIDHASGDQKLWLIQRITEEAVTLIQDPYGNYVVQYIIDLNDLNFTEPLVARFRGRICALSRHKFSSNVVEKCLRCSLEPSRDMIVEELLTAGEIERLVRDSYANYVVQTALEYATPYMKARLVDSIRPFLPQIRSTPHGRRIQAKIQAYDSRSGQSSGHITPAETSQGQIPLHGNHTRNGSASIVLPTSAFSTNNMNGIAHRANGVAGAALAGNGSAQTAVIGVPSGRPGVAQYGAPPQFVRTGMPPNGVPATVAIMPSIVPVSMAPNVAAGLPGVAAPGMGLANENGETAWL